MAVDTQTISFARGAPSLDLIPVEQLKESAIAAFDRDPAGTFGYGTAVGYPPLREWIADHHGVDVSRVIVTNGSLHACAMMFDRMVAPSDKIAIELPLYDRSLLMLRQRGADLIGFPLEDDGFDVAALEKTLRSGTVPKFVYTIPHFHNPAGCTMPLGKRQRLVELAEEHDFLILEDDPYRDVVFEGEPLPTMLSMDGSGERVFYMCSFTKTVCPGLRVGYAIASETVTRDLVTAGTNTYISPGMVSESILNEYLRSGKLGDSIQAIREALRERRDALTGALRELIPDARFVTPTGGYFLWVDLPATIDTDAVAATAAERGVPITRGSDFMLDGGRNCMRMSYSSATPEQIRAGVERLASIIKP
ncbi:MAG: PLP-dependent aminotransferase family protein [Solirubrobacterales bacterium]